MQNILTLRRHVIPAEQIVWIEGFDPTKQQPDFKADKDYRSRVVLINRDTHLSEETPEALAARLNFRFLAEDQTAVNGELGYQVERFEATAGFRPEKPFRTRLKWRDAEGKWQSKLLLTPPEIVVATVVRRNPARGISRRKVRKLESARS